MFSRLSMCVLFAMIHPKKHHLHIPTPQTQSDTNIPILSLRCVGSLVYILSSKTRGIIFFFVLFRFDPLTTCASRESEILTHLFRLSWSGLIGAIAGQSAAGLSVHEANLGTLSLISPKLSLPLSPVHESSLSESDQETFLGFTFPLRLRYVMENAATLAEV